MYWQGSQGGRKKNICWDMQEFDAHPPPPEMLTEGREFYSKRCRGHPTNRRVLGQPETFYRQRYAIAEQEEEWQAIVTKNVEVYGFPPPPKDENGNWLHGRFVQHNGKRYWRKDSDDDSDEYTLYEVVEGKIYSDDSDDSSDDS